MFKAEMKFRRLVQRGLAAAALLGVAGMTAAHAAPYGPYASTPGEASLASSLDSANAAPVGERAAMLQSLDALPTAAERADALGQLSARSYSLLPRLSIQSMDSADREIRSYLVERRNIASGAGSDVPVSGDRTINMMLVGGLKQATYKGRIDRPEAKSDSRSVRFAIDVSPIENLIVGATLGIDGIDARLDSGQKPRITAFNTNIGPYASYNNGKFYVDATAGYNFSEFKLRRQVGWTGFSDRLRANVDGDGWHATTEVGAMLRAANFKLQPFVGLQYRYADIGGFMEGGGAASLEVASYRTKSLRGNIGARASATIDKGRWAIRPSVEAKYQRELRSQPDSRIEARFVARDLDIFTLNPTRLARNAALLSAGASATYNSRTTFRLGYTGELSSDRHVHAAVLSVSRRF